jgi:hypothetical protein
MRPTRDLSIAVNTVIVLVIAKVIAENGSRASEISGGIFTPMLLVGAALGAGWSDITSFGSVSNAGGSALVGMAAATAASIDAPRIRKHGLGWEMTLEGRQLKNAEAECRCAEPDHLMAGPAATATTRRNGMEPA